MKIGPYETLRLLGKGGMSEVYEAENIRLGSRHALKLYAYDKDDPEVRDRFLVEGKLLARLNHPRIVKVTDFGTDAESGRPYFVMDLVLNGRGEMQLLSDIEPGTVDEEMIGRWYDDLRDGLAYIHANGVIHRDLKLQNVLIGPDGHAVLTDFGISKIFDAKGDGVQIVDTVRTLVKVKEGRSLVMGSLGYMAPELEMGVAASPQSDWYALGVIVYRMLTGTWCDARTDILGTLETYDPVWKSILPKLLHSNPNGRECLCYADEKRAAREKAECEAEERWLKAKDRGHLARHVARYVATVALALGAAWGYTVYRYRGRLAACAAECSRLEAELALPDFRDVIVLPEKFESNGGLAEGSGSWLAYIDAWVLTHGIFDDLKSGKISYGKAVDSLETLVRKVTEDSLGLFDLKLGYSQLGDGTVLAEMLEEGVARMRARACPASEGKGIE